jgi:hypothetical protein
MDLKSTVVFEHLQLTEAFNGRTNIPLAPEV